MGGPRWIQQSKDPYRRTVLGSELVGSMSGGMLFALSLDCGHTTYMSRETNLAPATYRCRLCIQDAIGDKPIRRRLTPAESAVEYYVNGADIRVMAAARAAIELEGVA